ncbi:hypothetical protein SAMN05421821_103407 [Mucilaginibacter lappiensis]|uniref:Lipocalin-like domain-containing protein n=1 Tax=Mucilaginibacter lappiensis TaxID=354630 RepID=A0ABR6PJL2_9SPHI|nr:hypothetical protein [Mucilaginibacter lappiensis]MBB6109170.1 hypothetical protein [Mucilaginibacter lappiensis]SIQ78453.1 hypothetical protein SAMN05421821_103407 [Mucilaginibacter lappiensis]
MKKIALITAICLFVFSVFSCSKKKDTTPVTNSDSNWKFGAYTYNRGASSQTSNSAFNVMVVTTTDGADKGAYSGSALIFTWNPLGAGKYTITTSTLVLNSPGTKLINVQCQIGTAVNTGSTRYDSGSTTATADVTVDASGKYHVTITQPVVLTKTLTTGTGVQGAADTYPLTVNNGY